MERNIMIIIDLNENETLVYDPLEYKALLIGRYIAYLLVKN